MAVPNKKMNSVITAILDFAFCILFPSSFDAYLTQMGSNLYALC